MKAERITLSGVGAVLLLTTVAVLTPSLTLGLVDWHSAFELLLWGTTVLFATSALVWLVLTYVIGAGYEPPTPVHGGDDIQVRILTVDAADVVQATVDSLPATFDRLVLSTDAEVLHSRWVTSQAAAAFNESVYYPYSSLQFHVLLVAALLDNYRAGHAFEDLHLVATPSAAMPDQEWTAEAARESEEVEPHRTVLWSPVCALHVTGEPGDRPSASLGSCPARSFADTWSRLSRHPFDAGDRRWRRLDAQLRRIRSWSTALAYIEDYVAVYGDGGVA